MIQIERRSATRRKALFAGFASAALIATTPAQAQVQHVIHIPAGPLDAALLALAEQSHEQLLYTPGLVAGRISPAVDGDLTAEQALIRLLGASDITVSRTGPSMLVLRPAPALSPPSIAQQGGAAPEPRPDRPFVGDGAPPPPTTTTVAEVQVTGTHIRGAQTASPLLVVTASDLQRTGQSTVVEALRTLPQNFGGGSADGTATTGADHTARNPGLGTGLNLRGLGNNATLVLVNGRRLAGSGSFGDFSDVSAIPTVAVERVEVLLDGASAVYGSDAVGGVVNIILRKAFDGAEARVLAGAATAGRPQEGQASLALGHRWDTGGVMLAYEVQQRGSLPGGDRPFSANADLRPLGGTDMRQTTSFPGNILLPGPTGALAPSFAIPAGQNGIGLKPSQLLAGVTNLQNQRLGEDLLPEQTLNAVYLTADQDVGDRLQLTADARYSDRRFRLHVPAPTANLTVTSANPFFVSPIGASSETIAYSFAGDLPPSQQSGSVETLALTMGGTLRLFGDWRGEGYLTYAQETDEIRNSGALNSLALNEALGTIADRADTPFSTAVNGFFNPFSGTPGSNKPAVLAFVGSGLSAQRSRDEVSTANLQADGSLWRLPAGPIKLALGGQIRREALTTSGFNFVSTVTPVATVGAHDGRTVSAGYAELHVPIFGPDNALPGVQSLALTLAGRAEHYQGIGTTANPTVGLVWQPIGDLHLRATYGTSFRAPALREELDPAIFVPSLLTLGATRIRTLILDGGNPGLRPETAESWTVGADFSSVRWPGLTLSATGFDVTFKNRIGTPVQANISRALSDPTLTSFVTLINPTANAADLAKITALLANPAVTTLNGVFPPTAFGAIADNRFVNTTTLEVSGLDLTGGYRFEVDQDAFALGANATYLLRYDQQITPSSPVADDVNVANFPVRFRGRLTADWTRGRVTTGLAFNYVGAYHDAFGVRIADQPTVDFQLRLAPPDHGILRGVTTLLNVRNLFDRDPPFYNNPVGIGYDAANADPIGRYISIQLTRAW